MKNTTRRIISVISAILLLMAIPFAAFAVSSSYSWRVGDNSYKITFTPANSTFIKKEAIEASINVTHTCGTPTEIYYYGECNETVTTTHNCRLYGSFLLLAVDNHNSFSSTVSRNENLPGITTYVPATCASGTYEMAAYFMCDSGTWQMTVGTNYNSIGSEVAVASYDTNAINSSGTVSCAPMYFYGYGYIEVGS